MKKICTLLLVLISISTFAQVNPKLQAKLEQQAKEMEAQVIQWRRHFHQFPELSNRETKTGAYIAKHFEKTRY